MSNDLKTNKMLVNVVLDRSGSMDDTRTGTISGYNEYINGLRADKESQYDVSLIQFDAHGYKSGPELTISYLDRPLADVPQLTLADYEPRGSTPLYDAIGECVRRVEAKDRAITVVIITDGLENASKEFDKDSVKALIDRKKTEGWTFVFLGAEIDSYAVGGSVGVATGNTSNYAKGMESQMYAAAGMATARRSHMNATVGVNFAAGEDFFLRSEKVAMGDTTTGAHNTITTITGNPQPQQGGSPTGRPIFPPAQRPGRPVAPPPKVERKKREWSTSDSK